jgi:hypothetical protein
MGRDGLTFRKSANGGANGLRRSERHMRHLRTRVIN